MHSRHLLESGTAPTGSSSCCMSSPCFTFGTYLVWFGGKFHGNTANTVDFKASCHGLFKSKYFFKTCVCAHCCNLRYFPCQIWPMQQVRSQHKIKANVVCIIYLFCAPF
jgi:hypothetical protein